MTRRLAAGSLGGIAVCLALSACGSQGAPPKPAPLPSAGVASALDAAAAAVKARGSADVAYTIKENVAGQAVTISATGNYDFDHRDGMIDETVPGLSGPIHGVFNGTEVAMQFPASIRTAAHVTKPWIGLSLASLGGQFQTSDPTQALQMLKGVGSVREVGTGTIDGIPCTHVVASVSFSKVVAAFAPDIRALLTKSKATFPATFPEDVWLDADNLPRRTTANLTFTVEGQKIVQDTTYDLSDFGAPVTISFPPSDQIQQEPSFTSFIASLAKAGAATRTSG